MKTTSLPTLVLVLLASVLALSSCALQPEPPPVTPTAPSAGRGTDAWRAEQVYLLARRENPRLAWNECLAQAAAVRSRQLVSENSFSHRDPATGKNPVYGIIGNCFEFRVAGENLTRGSDDPRELHRALMDSPSHRGNIMDPGYELIGVGCCGDYCVQLFAGF